MKHCCVSNKSKNMILDMSTPPMLDSAQSSSVIGVALKEFKNATKTPEIYLKIQNKRAEKHKELVKSLFDYAKSADDHVANAPSELIIEDMDEEQIWQQLELQNESLWSRCLRDTSKLLSAKDEALSVRFKIPGDESSGLEDDDEEIAELSGSESELGTEDDEEDIESDDPDSETDDPKQKSRRAGRSSIVDDTFFKLSEMEDFLEAEDRKEMRKTNGKRAEDSEDGFDYFKEDDDDDLEDNNYKYKDFFGAPDSMNEITDEEKRDRRRAGLEVKNKTSMKRKKADLGLEDESDIDENAGSEEIEEAEEDDDDDEPAGKVKFDLSKNSYRSDSEDDEKLRSKPYAIEEVEKSTFEHRQERLRLRIQDMEDQAMGEKSWQLRGEIDSTSRPQNSLLEEILEFDSTTRPAPVITEETTLRLEDIIRQRIKDKAWNDVERKYKTDNTPQEFRKKLTLDQEKSKESLAQIYEKEYLREVDRLDPSATEKDETEPKEHTEIRTLMKDLFVKLDALSNFFYTPKPAVPEAKIITNTPAISMEEVAPVSVSDAQMLAPEEVLAKSKSGDVLGKSERSRTDKNRERRQKKLMQRSKRVAKEKSDAVKEALGIVRSTKAEKQKMLEKVSKSRNVHKMKETTDGKSIKSSKQFFSQLQDAISTTVKGKSKGKRGKKNIDGEISAKRYKL